MNNFPLSDIVPKEYFWRFVLIVDVILLTMILLCSGCSTIGVDHWPVQVHSVDSGSN
jgi:hypothetical protein